MAAPKKWGNKVNDRGRIGIAISRSYSNSTVKVTLSVWFSNMECQMVAILFI